MRRVWLRTAIIGAMSLSLTAAGALHAQAFTGPTVVKKDKSLQDPVVQTFSAAEIARARKDARTSLRSGAADLSYFVNDYLKTAATSGRSLNAADVEVFALGGELVFAGPSGAEITAARTVSWGPRMLGEMSASWESSSASQRASSPVKRSDSWFIYLVKKGSIGKKKFTKKDLKGRLKTEYTKYGVPNDEKSDGDYWIYNRKATGNAYTSGGNLGTYLSYMRVGSVRQTSSAPHILSQINEVPTETSTGSCSPINLGISHPTTGFTVGTTIKNCETVTPEIPNGALGDMSLKWENTRFLNPNRVRSRTIGWTFEVKTSHGVEPIFDDYSRIDIKQNVPLQVDATYRCDYWDYADAAGNPLKCPAGW